MTQSETRHNIGLNKQGFEVLSHDDHFAQSMRENNVPIAMRVGTGIIELGVNTPDGCYTISINPKALKKLGRQMIDCADEQLEFRKQLDTGCWSLELMVTSLALYHAGFAESGGNAATAFKLFSSYTQDALKHYEDGDEDATITLLATLAELQEVHSGTYHSMAVDMIQMEAEHEAEEHL